MIYFENHNKRIVSAWQRSFRFVSFLIPDSYGISRIDEIFIVPLHLEQTAWNLYAFSATKVKLGMDPIVPAATHSVVAFRLLKRWV